MHSCYKIPAGKEKDLTLKIGLNLAEYLRKAGYIATPVACRWAGAVIEVNRAFGQEQWGQKLQKPQKK